MSEPAQRCPDLRTARGAPSLVEGLKTPPLPCLFPDENLALARDTAIARVASVSPVAIVVREREAERLQVLRVQAQERGLVRGGVRKRRQERDRLQRYDRAPIHPCPRPQLGAAPEHDGATFH